MGMQDVVDALLGRPGAKVQKRGSILPMVKTDEGMGLGWPEMALDAWKAVSLPKAALEGYQATPEDIGNFALTVGAGGLGASTFAKPKGKILGMFSNSDTPPLGRYAKEPIGRAPGVKWGGQDTQGYRPTAAPNETVEQVYVPLSQVPKPKLVGGKTRYDWSEIERGGDMPPVTLKENKNGSLSIVDGNHRIHAFKEQGFDSVPAYVIRPRSTPSTPIPADAKIHWGEGGSGALIGTKTPDGGLPIYGRIDLTSYPGQPERYEIKVGKNAIGSAETRQEAEGLLRKYLGAPAMGGIYGAGERQ
jgi:hypothetical protein